MSDLNDYRREIDTIDEQIMDLLAKRQALVVKIAHAKKTSDTPAFQPKRHEFIMNKQKAAAVEHGLDPKLVTGIWQSLMHESIRVQNQVLEKNS